jgi:hypothetical protein
MLFIHLFFLEFGYLYNFREILVACGAFDLSLPFIILGDND